MRYAKACETLDASREQCSCLPNLSREDVMMFTYVASPSQSGNQNVRRVCSNSKCGGTMYVTHGADNYRCPHCDHRQ